MQEGIQLGAAQLFEIDSLHPAITPQAGHQVRDRLARAYRGKEEDRSLRDQIPEKGQRGGVQQRRRRRRRLPGGGR